MKFSDDEEETEEVDGNKNQQILSYEELKKKIEIKKNLKNKRQRKIENIDWQLLRLPTMAKKINNIFLTEKKASLNMKNLCEKLKFMGCSPNSIENDLDRIIQKTDGWLKVWKGRLKRNPDMDINKIVIKLEDCNNNTTNSGDRGDE